MTTATILPMPGIRMGARQQPPCEQRAALLMKLARQFHWLDPDWVDIIVGALADESLTRARRDEAWADVLDKVALADSIDAGVPVDWDWRCDSCGHRLAMGCDDFCCPSALQYARDAAAEALAVLAGGAP